MPFATWWRGDLLPELAALPSFEARQVTGWADAQRVTGLTENRILIRHEAGHRLYGAFLDDEPVGYGWIAKRAGGIYLFTNLPDAETYAQKHIARLTEAGVRDIVSWHFDVNSKLSAMTGAPGVARER